MSSANSLAIIPNVDECGCMRVTVVRAARQPFGERPRPTHPARANHVRAREVSRLVGAPFLVRDVRPEILLQIRVLVIVDAHEPVPRALRQVLHQTRLAAGRGSLE